MKSLSLRARLTLLSTLSFGLLMLLAGLAVYAGMRELEERGLEADVRTLAATELASAVDEQEVHIHEFPVEALGAGEYVDKLAQLFRADGTRLLASPPHYPPVLDDPQLRARALRGEAPLFERVIDGRRALLGALLARKNDQQYVLVVGLFRDRVDASLARLARLMVLVGLAGFLLVAALSYIVASHAVQPIGKIAERASLIAAGDLEGRLDPPRSQDELGRMTGLLNDMLASLQRALAANRRFAADASHELRGPLTSLRGEIDVALRRERSEVEYRATLETLRRHAERMSQLIESLTTLVRAQEGRVEVELADCRLRTAVEESIERLADAAARREVTIRHRIDDDWFVRAHAPLLARTLDNLIGNAIQYNRQGGTVEVVVFPEPGERVRLEVRDTGCGVPETERERIFTPFARLDPARQRATGGFGLGLALCREIAQLLGGTVTLAHSSPAGSCFVLVLPRGTAVAVPSI